MNITINDVAIDADEWASGELAAVRELLRQQAVALGLLEANADHAAVTAGIEQLLAREVTTPSPAEEECRRYYDVHAEEFRSGDLVYARHILFQVTARLQCRPGSRREQRTTVSLPATPASFG